MGRINYMQKHHEPQFWTFFTLKASIFKYFTLHQKKNLEGRQILKFFVLNGKSKGFSPKAHAITHFYQHAIYLNFFPKSTCSDTLCVNIGTYRRLLSPKTCFNHYQNYALNRKNKKLVKQSEHSLQILTTKEELIKTFIIANR